MKKEFKNYIDSLYEGALIYPLPIAGCDKDRFCPILIVEDSPGNYYTTCPMPMWDYAAFSKEVRKSYVNIEFVAWPALNGDKKAPRGVKLFIDKDYIESDGIDLESRGEIEVLGRNSEGKRIKLRKKIFALADVGLVIEKIYKTSARAMIFRYNFNEEWAVDRKTIRKEEHKIRQADKKAKKKAKMANYTDLLNQMSPSDVYRKPESFKNIVTMAEINRINKAAGGGKKMKKSSGKKKVTV